MAAARRGGPAVDAHRRWDDTGEDRCLASAPHPAEVREPARSAAARAAPLSACGASTPGLGAPRQRGEGGSRLRGADTRSRRCILWGMLVLVAAGCLAPARAQTTRTLTDAEHGIGLQLAVEPLSAFYDCTVTGNDVMYETEAACVPACYAGSCVRRTAEGALSAAHRDTHGPRAVVYVTLSPVLLVGDNVTMVITAAAGSTVAVEDDPGLPIGMTAEPRSGGAVLTVSWVPRVGQGGAVHELFVAGTSLSGTRSNASLCVRFAVAAGALAWDKPRTTDTEVHAIVAGQVCQCGRPSWCPPPAAYLRNARATTNSSDPARAMLLLPRPRRRSWRARPTTPCRSGSETTPACRSTCT